MTADKQFQKMKLSSEFFKHCLLSIWYIFQQKEAGCWWKLVYWCKVISKQRKDGGKFKVTLESAFVFSQTYLPNPYPKAAISSFRYPLWIAQTCTGLLVSVTKRLLKSCSRKDAAFPIVINQLLQDSKRSNSCLQLLPYNFILVFYV